MGHSLGAQPLARGGRSRGTSWMPGGDWAWRATSATARTWVEADGVTREQTARLVGARPTEVATMNTLTVNLHLLMASFYRPTGTRTAVLIEAPTFPSDRYAVESQLRLHGLDPARDLIVVGPRTGRVDAADRATWRPPSRTTGDRSR